MLLKVTAIVCAIGNLLCLQKKVKKMEKIHHPNEYIRILDNLNNVVLKVNILDFEKLFSEFFTEKLKVKISFQKDYLSIEWFCYVLQRLLF